MKREDVDAMVADAMAEHFMRLRTDFEAHIDRRIAEKPLPPFVPPMPWTPGRHGAGAVVRHRNGVFSARRDTEREPGTDEAWLPILVGLAGIDLRWEGERTVALRAMLSDGTSYEMIRTLAVPIVRGYWSAEAEYEPGDRVFRFGEWHAVQSSRAIDPTSPAADGIWLKVSGKQARGLAFTLDDEGTFFEGGRAAGSLKPLIEKLLTRHLGPTTS